MSAVTEGVGGGAHVRSFWMSRPRRDTVGAKRGRDGVNGTGCSSVCITALIKR